MTRPAISQGMEMAAQRATAIPSQFKEATSHQDYVKYLLQLVKTSLPLLMADVFAYLFSFLIAFAIGSFLGVAPSGISPPAYLYFLMIGSLIVAFTMMGLYSGFGMHPIYEFRQCMMGNSLAFVIILGATTGNGYGIQTLLAYPILLAFVPIIRSTIRHLMATHQWWGVRCLLFSCDRRVNSLLENHLSNRTAGFRPVGFLQDELPEDTKEDYEPLYKGVVTNARRAMRENNAYVALVHRRGRTDEEVAAFVERRLRSFSQILIVADDDRLPSLWTMGQNGGIVLEDRLLRPQSQFIKRAMDKLLAGGALLFGIPLFAVIAVWIKLTSPGPLFFGHERIGKDGKRFKAWKFRSMCVNADEVLRKTLEESPEMREEWEATQKLKNDPRISSSGRFLRRTSLDELPQLWNVFKGEMSLVGPRPIVTSEIEKYDHKFESYLRVTPGVTGFWQVSGRNLTTYEKRVELDDFYVRNWSIWFDLYILFRTVKTVLLREGAF